MFLAGTGAVSFGREDDDDRAEKHHLPRLSAVSLNVVSPCISSHLLASPCFSPRAARRRPSREPETEPRSTALPPLEKEARIASKEEDKEEKEEHNGTLRTARRPRARSPLAVDRTVIRLGVDELAVGHCRDHDGRTSLALASLVRLPLSIPGSSIGENSLEGTLRRPDFPGSAQSKPKPDNSSVHGEGGRVWFRRGPGP
ncbi:hypothetical protein BGZ61DRAFT_485410 [Ilyonectria robusta]|uniref:uncharacterized protein n=1 Tax=Ilyonectria robusta TaxID=1079257 RepID=UPI001E8CD3DB|nr:uncharacterized protein BGZ61DRAFT_485410 [Ilyonectria robusta]KAH8661278.1 hypothetical protein BGZ61DRAFT_485410 [Ilyonectria robusta]